MGPEMGSPDPHRTGEVDSVPARKPCAPAIAAHVPASDDELLRRAFPEANVPPVTCPLPPPLLPPACPPVVTSVEQVVPRQSLARVRRWMRQLRRCMRMARAGNLSGAWRMRPADMWLDHAEHSCPGTAPWDWDLRPLLLGLPAVPMAVSGVDGVRPATSLDLAAVLAAAEGFVDLAIVSEMVQGVTDDSCCRRGTLLCAPHRGALAELEQATAKLDKNVAKGWAGEPSALPCWPLRTCPYSVVDESLRAGEPKYRLTTDLSWPPPDSMWVDGVCVDSVNGAMDRSRWPANKLMRVGEFAEAMAILQGARRQRRVRVWSVDCEAFYRAVGRQRSELWRAGVVTEGGVMLDERCCFGDAAAAVKCSRMSNLIVFRMRAVLAGFDAEHPPCEAEWVEWQAERRAIVRQAGGSETDADAAASLSWVGMYIDDATCGGADDLLYTAEGVPVMQDGVHVRRQQRHFELARVVLAELGWRSAPAKEQPPRERLEALGVVIDLAESRVFLSDGKRERYGAQAARVAACAACAQGEFRELLGRLQFATMCFPRGQHAMHAMWRAMRVQFRSRGGMVMVSTAITRDLLWWVAELADVRHEGVPLAACDGPATGVVLYADASVSDDGGGFAAWTVVDGVAYVTSGVWSEAERGLLICDLELLASTFGLVAFEALLGSRWVWSFTDNTVAEAAMRRGIARSPAMQAMLVRRGAWLHERGLLEVPRRISSKANVWADVGSRPELGGVEAVRAMAAEAGLELCVVPVPPEWRDTDGLLCPDPVWS